MSPDFLLDLFVQYGYWIIFLGILLDNAGLPLPGELFLLAFGALARTGEVDLGFGLALAFLAAVSGDNIGYWMGRLGGQRLLHVYCHVTLGSSRCVRDAVAFYRLRGPVTVVFGRFVMGVRAFLAPLAGSVRMPYLRFLAFDILGAATWAGAFVLSGYALGWQLQGIEHGYRTGAKLLTFALGAAFVVYIALKLRRRWQHGAAAPTTGTTVRVPGGTRRGSGPSPRAAAIPSPEGSPVEPLSARHPTLGDRPRINRPRAPSPPGSP
jgi:membrane protein DedA with SNARE-associated domain